MFCKMCQMAKCVRSSYFVLDNRSDKSLDLIHSDIWSLSAIPTFNGYQFFLIFIDDYSSYPIVYMIRN